MSKVCGESSLAADVRRVCDVKACSQEVVQGSLKHCLGSRENDILLFCWEHKEDRVDNRRKEGLISEICQERHHLRNTSLTMTPPPIKHKALLNVDLGEAVSRL